jgi:hypothetical protein
MVSEEINYRDLLSWNTVHQYKGMNYACSSLPELPGSFAGKETQSLDFHMLWTLILCHMKSCQIFFPIL